MKTILLIVCFLLPLAVFAQEGSITVVQDSGVKRVLKLYQTFARERRAISGYRIQLGSSGNRQVLMDIKAKFLQLYPDVGAYIQYQQPQFKLRVGDFRSRADADAFLEELLFSFSSGFIVPDKIYVQGIPW
jgi:hypothetical protein